MLLCVQYQRAPRVSQFSKQFRPGRRHLFLFQTRQCDNVIIASVSFTLAGLSQVCYVSSTRP